ncbi:hypothetical protein [Lentzea sp. NPDC051838]|uniref:hypothetical protein n=1 Tax=Lentzea sp. NPDC051838 TaxID=3154849 RepID=UPI0034194323
MSDLRTLRDAFAELDRRADAATTGTAPVVRPRRVMRLVPVAATVAAVACLVAGAVWLVPRDPGTQVAGPPTTAPSTTTGRVSLPTSPDDLIARFRVVLGDTATFEVTDKGTVPKASPSGQPGSEPGVIRLDGPDGYPFAGGTLTSADVTGSFNLAVHFSDSKPTEWCRLARTNGCDVSTLPGGSRLVTGTGQEASGAVWHLACLVRPDGMMVIIRMGNQEDPGGAVPNTPGGRFLGPRPPLTLDQLKAIVTSDKW